MTEEKIEKAIDERLDEPDNEWDGIFNSGYSKGFRDGAQWRINSVWHNLGKEMPECNRRVVNEDWFDFIAKDEKDLARIIKKYPFKQWAYVDDLLLERKEEEK